MADEHRDIRGVDDLRLVLQGYASSAAKSVNPAPAIRVIAEQFEGDCAQFVFADVEFCFSRADELAEREAHRALRELYRLVRKDERLVCHSDGSESGIVGVRVSVDITEFVPEAGDLPDDPAAVDRMLQEIEEDYRNPCREYRGLDHDTMRGQPGFLKAMLALQELGVARPMRVVVTHGASKVIALLAQTERLRSKMAGEDYANYLAKLIYGDFQN